MKARLVLCPPDHFQISYSINPWMDVDNKSHHHIAVQQWNALKNKLKELDVEVLLIDPIENQPDMVFTANAGLVLKDKHIVILSNFKYDERKGEEIGFRSFFARHDYKVIQPNRHFEGAGDALFILDYIVCAHGFRSDYDAYAEISSLVGGPVIYVQLADSRFYHLDTCFCPLQDGDYMIFPGAFGEHSLEAIRVIKNAGGEEIIVPEDEALKFACNAVVIENNVVLPSGCPKTMEMLTDAGYIPHPVDMSEYLKSGGACKCLTIAL